jgi:hypothetical protein
VPIPLEIIMKLATAINTLQQQFGLYDIQYDRRDEGQFKPYEFYMLTDKFSITLVDPSNRRSHRNYLQSDSHWLPANVDYIVNDARRLFVEISPRLTANMTNAEYRDTFIKSVFAIKRGDTDFIKNLLSQIA